MLSSDIVARKEKYMPDRAQTGAFGSGGTNNPNAIITKQEVVDEVKDPVNPRGSSGSSSSVDYSAWFNYLMDLQDAKYRAEAKANKEAWQRRNDETNRNYMRNRKDWERVYSNQRNGQGLSNLFNAMANRDSAIRANRSEYDTAMANANANRYDALYGMTSMLPQMDATTLQKIMQNVANRGL